MTTDQQHPIEAEHLALQISELRRSGCYETKEEIPSRFIDASTSEGKIRIGLGPSGEAKVLIPVSRDEKISNSYSGKSLVFTTGLYSLSGQKQKYLDIKNTSPELDEIFFRFIIDVIQKVLSGIPAVRSVTETFEEYRQLFSSEIPDKKKVRGLVGELYTLRELLRCSPDAWRCWNGPQGNRHDFNGRDITIEVKTTSVHSQYEIKISSLEQLLEPEGSDLYLFNLTIEEVNQGELSISSLFREITALTSAHLEIRHLLRECGCEDPDSPEWNQSRFKLFRQSMYTVKDNFPRLIPKYIQSNMRDKVSDISYSVDLSQAEEYIILPAQVPSIFKGIITG